MKTKDIQAKITAITDGSGCGGKVHVDATLHVTPEAGGGGVRLAGGEELTVSYQDDKESMSTDDDSWGVTYYADLSNDDDEGNGLKVVFDRAGTSSAKPSASVQIPEAFEPKVATKSEFSRARDTVTITWDKGSTASEKMSWRAAGTCIEEATGDISSGSTSLTISSRKLVQASDAKSTTCQVTVTLDRTREGSVDSAFAADSTITAIQRRFVRFSSKP